MFGSKLVMLSPQTVLFFPRCFGAFLDLSHLEISDVVFSAIVRNQLSYVLNSFYTTTSFYSVSKHKHTFLRNFIWSIICYHYQIPADFNVHRRTNALLLCIRALVECKRMVVYFLGYYDCHPSRFLHPFVRRFLWAAQEINAKNWPKPRVISDQNYTMATSKNLLFSKK